MVGVVVVAVMPVRCCSLRMSKTVMGLFSERQMALSQVLFKVPLELKDRSVADRLSYNLLASAQGAAEGDIDPEQL